MTARDLALWEQGFEKVDAGVPELLTNAEWVTLMHFGGEDIFRRGKRRTSEGSKSRGPLETTTVGPLIYTAAMPIVRRS